MNKDDKYMMYENGDWYDQFIEHPLRDLVRVLRKNGINTECSCGHEMYIQCQHIPDGELMDLHELIWNYLSENKLPINFEIIIEHTVIEGSQYTTLDIKLPNKKGLKQKMKKIYSSTKTK